MKTSLSICFIISMNFLLAQNYSDWKTNVFQEGDTILVPNETIKDFGYYNWYDLNPKAYQYLSDFINYHPEIKELKILNHTSYRGSDVMNLEISSKRAENLKEYLEIACPSVSFSYEGLGEAYPFSYIDSIGKRIILNAKHFSKLTDDKTEYERLHSMNRRFEFVVLKVDSTQLSKRINSDIRFTNTQEGGIFKIPEIRYDFAKWYLQKNDSVNSVDSLKILADFMKEHPNIVVEIMVHTDCRGSKYSSTCLSCRRAQSVVDCLIEYYGIEKDRLVAKGYGETEPKTVLDGNGNRVVLTCDYINSLPTKDEQERMHQMNRRTEFQILSWDFEVEIKRWRVIRWRGTIA